MDGTQIEIPADAVPERVQPVPAVDISIVSTLAGDRQIQMRTAILQETGEAEANEILDRLFRLADRQKARYELDGLVEKLEGERGLRPMLKQFTEDALKLAEDHEKAQAKRKEQIAELNRAGEERFKVVYDDARKRGVQGDIEPRGSEKANLKRIKDQIASISAEMHKAEEEHKAAVGNLQQNVARYTEGIVQLEGEIEKRRALLG